MRGEACCPLNGDIVACRAFIASAIQCVSRAYRRQCWQLQVPAAAAKHYLAAAAGK